MFMPVAKPKTIMPCAQCGNTVTLGAIHEDTDTCERCWADNTRKAELRRSFGGLEFFVDMTQSGMPEIRQALAQAAAEGRLHPELAEECGLATGTVPCPVCGMLHWVQSGADACCLPGLEEYKELYVDIDPHDHDLRRDTMMKRGLVRAEQKRKHHLIAYMENRGDFVIATDAAAGDSGGMGKLAAEIGVDPTVIRRLRSGACSNIAVTSYHLMREYFGGDIPGVALFEEEEDEQAADDGADGSGACGVPEGAGRGAGMDNGSGVEDDRDNAGTEQVPCGAGDGADEHRPA